MRRREFFRTALVPLLAPPRDDLDELRRVAITKITGFRHVATRPKVVGKSATRDVRGRLASEEVLRIATDADIEGVGVGSADPDLARGMLGRSLDEFWKPGIGVVSPLGRADHALYDLVGKVLNRPTWQVLGGMGPKWVPVYDASFHFNDLLPEFQARGVARLVEEVEASLKAGHRAFKLKVGRGAQVMEPEAGYRRDVEVVRAVRKLVGKEARLMVDADDAFDLETTERWLDAVGDELFFVEEMFPEQVDRDLLLKDYLRKKGLATRVADGASADDLDDFEGFVANEALDVLQPDVRTFGLTRLCALARKAGLKPGITIAPHNGASSLGLSMQLTLARGIPNFLIAEQDPCTSDLFDASAFELKEGKIRVPDTPGCGVVLRESVFKERYRAKAWVVE